MAALGPGEAVRFGAGDAARFGPGEAARFAAPLAGFNGCRCVEAEPAVVVADEVGVCVGAEVTTTGIGGGGGGGVSEDDPRDMGVGVGTRDSEDRREGPGILDGREFCSLEDGRCWVMEVGVVLRFSHDVEVRCGGADKSSEAAV